MGFKDSLKGMIFEEDDSKNKSDNGQAVPKSPALPQQIQQPRQPANPVYSTQTYSLDPLALEAVRQVAAQAPQQSFKEFSNFLNALAVVISDERNRYVAAIASASAKGFPADEIIRGIDVVVKAVDASAAQIHSAVPQQIEKNVGPKKLELTSTEEQIRKKQALLQQLTVEINQLNSSLQIKRAEVASEEKKIKDKDENFSRAAEVVRAEFLNERQRVVSYSGIAVSANPTT